MTKKGLPLVDAWSRGLDKIHTYLDGDAKDKAVVTPARDTTARDQSMVESGVHGRRRNNLEGLSEVVALTSVDGYFILFYFFSILTDDSLILELLTVDSYLVEI